MISGVIHFDFLKMPEMGNLINGLHAHAQFLQPDVRRNMYHFAANVFINFPQLNRASPEVLQYRSEYFKSFIAPVLSPLSDYLNTQKPSEENLRQLSYTLLTIEACCESLLTSATSNSKKILFYAMDPVILMVSSAINKAADQHPGSKILT